MPSYSKAEAREWARETMHGCANVIIASYSADLRRLNEAGIRHDVRREKDLGFWGCLLVSETSLSLEEYLCFVEWAVDEARGELHFVHHASFDTLEENITAANRAASMGAELVLLSYPAGFYPTSSEDIFNYTKAFCDGVDLGVVLFAVPLWGFERLHPNSLDPLIVRRLVDEVPNVVAVKAEGGMSIGSFVHLHHLVGSDVIVTNPLEDQGIPLAALAPMPWMGTSCMEYYGSSMPTMLNLVNRGEVDKAMDIYWQIAPARLAATTVARAPGSNLVHRYAWKYMAWLNGFNGGPLRMPTMRVVGAQMRALRGALEQSALEVTADGDEAFFVGRNPC